MAAVSMSAFGELDLRIGRVVVAERVAGSGKLVRLDVNLGEKDEAGIPQSRQIVAGIGNAYAPEELIGKLIAVVANLEPKMLMGIESRGMLLAASCDGEPVLLTVERDVEPGAKIR